MSFAGICMERRRVSLSTLALITLSHLLVATPSSSSAHFPHALPPADPCGSVVESRGGASKKQQRTVGVSAAMSSPGSPQDLESDEGNAPTIFSDVEEIGRILDGVTPSVFVFDLDFTLCAAQPPPLPLAATLWSPSIMTCGGERGKGPNGDLRRWLSDDIFFSRVGAGGTPRTPPNWCVRSTAWAQTR